MKRHEKILSETVKENHEESFLFFSLEEGADIFDGRASDVFTAMKGAAWWAWKERSQTDFGLMTECGVEKERTEFEKRWNEELTDK